MKSQYCTMTARQLLPICLSWVRYPCHYAICYQNKDNEDIDTDLLFIFFSSNFDEESQNYISDDSINDFPTEIKYLEKMSFDDHCRQYSYDFKGIPYSISNEDILLINPCQNLQDIRRLAWQWVLWNHNLCFFLIVTKHHENNTQQFYFLKECKNKM